MILDRINSPDDLKQLGVPQLQSLAREIRQRIIEVVSKNGGHLASNLGAVELTIALHRVFNSPQDKIIWDVGHQCYTHKLLTGRRDSFASIRCKGGLSGFPKRLESEHDIIETGHSSTSLSAGLGVLIGQELSGVEGKVISVIGDGALTGGIAYEALNCIGHLQKKLIIILNDNNMSIAPNVGALSSHLSRLTATNLYQDLRDRIDTTIKGIPRIGSQLYDSVVRLKKGVKAVFYNESIFSDLGFEYVGPIDGHNISVLLDVLRDVKDLDRPVVVHLVTKKGKGYDHAEGNPSLYHGVSPFSVVDGKIEKKNILTYTEAFSDLMLDFGKSEKKIVAISAAMTKGTGLSPFEKEFPDRFFDVGITEQHAVTFSAGLALSGMRPVVALYSTFLQRAVDQIIHDVALVKAPVVIALDRSGLVGNDGDTHQGVFDVPLLRGIPNMTLTAPASVEEMKLLFQRALEENGPTVVRYPKAICPSIPETDVPAEPGKGIFIRRTEEDILLLGVGSMTNILIEVASRLHEQNIGSDVYNLRYLKPLNERYLVDILSAYRFVFCYEEGSERGGIGEAVMGLCKKHNLSVTFFYKGVPDSFIPHAQREELLHDCGLDCSSVEQEIVKTLTSSTHLRVMKRKTAGNG